MNRKVLSLSILAILFGSTFQSAPAQDLDRALFNPDVVTFWHRLGIPQSVGRYRRFRDSRVNRNGLNPGRERKPPLLRLADPKNLEEGAPEMLKAAAKIKMDQDLAPQKLKALKYICSIGCSCYNKKLGGIVEKALMEGMEDCTESVRLAAIQAVIANAGSQCGCEGQCHTCCSEGVLKKLNEVAFKMDEEGCYLEPSEKVRNLAQRALDQCPPPLEKPKNGGGQRIGDGGEGDEDQGQRRIGDGEDDDSTGPQPDDEAGLQDPSLGGVFNQVSTRRSAADAWVDPGLAELQIRGTVRVNKAGSQNFMVEFVEPFEVPAGSRIVIASDEFNASMGQVLTSDTGIVLVVVDDIDFATHLRDATKVRLGVLE